MLSVFHAVRTRQNEPFWGGAMRQTRSVIGVVLCLIGALWFGQGVGWVNGSFMSGQAVWAVIGAVAILFGVTLFRPPRSRRETGK